MTRKNLSTLVFGILGTLPLLCLAWVFAENQAKTDHLPADPADQQLVLAEPASDAETPVYAPSSHWIGVQVVPVPEVLLSQFGMKDDAAGLVAVEQVVADSPAAKSGVRRGDVVVTFGGKEIHSLQELVRQVAEAKDAEQTMGVIREGKPTELKVTPEPRPAQALAMRNFGGRTPSYGMQHGMRPMQPPANLPPGMKFGPDVWIGNRDPREMMKDMEDYFRQMQGGIDGEQLLALPDEAVPEGIDLQGSTNRLEMSSKTDADGNTKVHVKQYVKNDDGVEEKTYEASSVEELPEEIRGEVQKLFGR